MEESIYNIIPREAKPEPKTPLYRSKYPHYIPPTGSTFCHHTTSKPGVKSHIFSSQIFPENSRSEYKPTLNLEIVPHWATSNMIVVPRHKISEKNTQEQWEATPCHLCATSPMIAATKKHQFLNQTKNLSSVWVLEKTSSWLMLLRPFYRAPERLKSLWIGYRRKISVKFHNICRK